MTIGNFDGVHRGHRAVLRMLAESCRREGLKPLAVTFTSHPLELVAPSRAPHRLMSPEEKARAISAEGADVLMLDFNEELRKLTAARFMERLRDEYGMKLLVLGYDNTFGSDRLSSQEDYRLIGEKLGIRVDVCTCLPGISSSSLRRELTAGNVEKAEEGLGYPYRISGTVIHGDRIGHTLGFPTANLRPDDPARLIPADGVYAGFAELNDGKMHPAVINIGVRPTVTSSGEKRIEAHLPGFSRDIYGEPMTLHFIARLRGEKKMTGPEELRETIEADIASALRRLPLPKQK